MQERRGIRPTPSRGRLRRREKTGKERSVDAGREEHRGRALSPRHLPWGEAQEASGGAGPSRHQKPEGPTPKEGHRGSSTLTGTKAQKNHPRLHSRGTTAAPLRTRRRGNPAVAPGEAPQEDSRDPPPPQSTRSPPGNSHSGGTACLLVIPTDPPSNSNAPLHRTQPRDADPARRRDSRHGGPHPQTGEERGPGPGSERTEALRAVEPPRGSEESRGGGPSQPRSTNQSNPRTRALLGPAHPLEEAREVPSTESIREDPESTFPATRILSRIQERAPFPPRHQISPPGTLRVAAEDRLHSAQGLGRPRLEGTHPDPLPGDVESRGPPPWGAPDTRRPLVLRPPTPPGRIPPRPEGTRPPHRTAGPKSRRQEVLPPEMGPPLPEPTRISDTEARSPPT
ncbi:hypothetical protein MG293_017874 [Ovis ammon polii]|uniref:Uncharacterized protein n=1 Tax=Ovis ammon polii TaxID=230172 RepID=A0AAD4TS40_OVIAM|nr:hypothetical protein MG293_017874 [Ovis ammon polii]